MTDQTTPATPRNILLGAFQLMNPNGTVGASWRVPGNTSLDYLTLEHWTRLGRLLEQGGFDFLFFADSYGYPTVGGEVIPTALTDAMYVPMADPITVVSAIAAATESLGLVITSSTTVERPVALARRYGTLDHLTQGRIGWNVVTGAAQSSAAELFGEAMLAHDERYDHAEDHLRICLNLWQNSWDDDALLVDRAAGVFADPARVRQVEHQGRYLRSRGIFNLPPSPQRTPLLVQAGTSAKGREFAAKYAEVVFVGGSGAAMIGEQVTDIRRRAAAHGRSAGAVKVVVGAHFLAAPTRDEAERKRADMLALATLEQAATTYAWVTGIDLTQLPLDEPLPDLHTELGQSSVDRYMRLPIEERPTVRAVLQEYRDNGLNGTIFVGDGPTVADEVEEFLAATGADGFLVQPHLTPSTYEDLIDIVIPELRSRGLLAKEAAPSSLRRRVFPAGGDRLPDDHPGVGRS